MLYVLIGIGLLITGLAFILTEKNAPTLLAGYNTMSPEEQANYPLQDFLQLYKRFHLVLGLSMIVFGIALRAIWGDNAMGLVLALYPLLGYLYFMFRVQQLSPQQNNSSMKVGVGVLAFTTILVMVMLWMGFRPIEVELSEDHLALKGMYGKTIPLKEVVAVSLEDQLPEIRHKTNGYAMGKIAKGYFKTADGEKVRLLVDEESERYVCITSKDGLRTYLGQTQLQAEALYAQLVDQVKVGGR